MLRKLALTLAVIGAASLPLVDGGAAAFGTQDLGAGKVLPVENAQFFPFFFGGNNFCWYPAGWNGPGWYWCGYAWRHGYGWGGGQGWRGHYYGAVHGPRPGGWVGHGPRPGVWPGHGAVGGGPRHFCHGSAHC